jgi:hypothetical protein
VAVRRPDATRSDTPAGDGPRIAPGAVTDALTTAFMLLGVEDIEALCEHSPGLEAWILPASTGEPIEDAQLLHFGGVARGKRLGARG